MSAGPEAVAEKVVKALEAANPQRARYPAGQGRSGPSVTARKVLPDRAMDLLVRQAFKG